MAVLKILPVQNQILREKAKSVQILDKRIQKLIKDLDETLKVQKRPIGVGLAAPQVGKSLRMFVIKRGKEIIPFINPEIIWKSEETNDPHSSSASRRTSSGQASRDKKRPEKFTLNESEREYIMEGCLSLPHYYGPVQRAKKIKVKYQTPELTTNLPARQAGHLLLITVTNSLSGLLAQIIQHEIDHLNGILFIDRLLEQKRKLFKLVGKEWEEVELP